MDTLNSQKDRFYRYGCLLAKEKVSYKLTKVILLLYVELFTPFLYKIYYVLQLLTVKDSGLSGVESEMYKELEMQVSTYTKNKHHLLV